MPPNRVIIDTDPGIDDVLALLLALSASPEDIEVMLISVTFGNIDVQNCLRNLVSMFHVIRKEMDWRKSQGLPEGFETLKKFKPLVAVGAEEPLGDWRERAAHIHGNDGLGGVHTSHPHHSCPKDTWKTLFDRPPSDTLLTTTAVDAAHTAPASPISLFTPSIRESHLEILRLLDENPPDTITIIAVGPLTNLALAASHSPTTFLRAKSVLVMGGAVLDPGNVTPVAEFNTMADPIAAARVFALTSPNPSSTMPPHSNTPQPLPPYPPLRANPLSLILFSLDITEHHTLRRDAFTAATQHLAARGSPLADWVSAFLRPTFRAIESLHHGHGGGATALSLHDPLCVWYALTAGAEPTAWEVTHGDDVRVETGGQWTRGMCVLDRRSRKKAVEEGAVVVGDEGGWLAAGKGNRVRRCVGTPGEGVLAPFLLKTVFG